MIFKCKMCGGDIEINNEEKIAKCLYCKSTMTLPSTNDEKILNLYNRANNLRLQNEFDKSLAIYESILELDNKQVEAHWGIVLSKYGVEYVDDPKTKKKIPTCHRTITSSILNDTDYLYIKDNSYGDALELYKKEAKEINEIQKGILEISNNEEPYDIFICYKETGKNNERTPDSVLAQEIYDRLTDKGYKVFFARKTLENKLGTEYEPYIFNALTTSRVMLVVGTNEENLNSVWVKNEWSRYLDLMKKDKNKVLIPVYSKMDAYELPESFSMLQAVNMDKLGSMQDLLDGVNKIISNISKSNDIKVTDDEVFDRFKKMIEEEKRLKEKNKLYDVAILIEKADKQFIKKLFLISLSVAIFMILGCLIPVMKGTGEKGITYINRALYHYVPIEIHVIVAISTLIAFILGIISKKTYKFSKPLYILNIILELIFCFSVFNKNIHLGILFYPLVILQGILLIQSSSWKIEEIKDQAVKEELKIIEEKNKKIKNNFVPLLKSKYNILYVIFTIIALIIMIAISFIPLKEQTNKKDESHRQITITSDAIRIRVLHGYDYR